MGIGVCVIQAHTLGRDWSVERISGKAERWSERAADKLELELSHGGYSDAIPFESGSKKSTRKSNREIEADW